jgi:hypothetical protein
MTHRILSTAWFVVFASLTAPSYPAEPEFKVGLVTESRTYEREELRKSQVPAAVAQPVRVQIERVTVALEGERITGEWYSGIMFSSDPLMSRWPVTLAKDFPLDTDVQAAIRGNELRLKHPDGTLVRARIVDRVNSEEDEDERD